MKILSNNLTLIISIVGTILATLSATAKEKRKPNIIFILADDLGYAELGCYGNTFNETPNIDALAQKGIRFANAYAQTVSSPSRAALMTGLYPQRTGIIDYLRPNDVKFLGEHYTTIPEALKEHGYRTAMIGKWHQSGYIKAGAAYESSPDKHGFDEVILAENEGIYGVSFFHPYHFNKEVKKVLPGEKEYLVDRMNVEAIDFIDRQEKDKPFFLYLSHYAVHIEVHGKPEDVDYFRSKPGAGTSEPSKNNPENNPYKKWPADYHANRNNPHLAAQLRDIDSSVGEIIAKLKEKGMLDNSIIIFTSDNGGELQVTTNAPLRAGKSFHYEGGIRIPMVVSAPGMLPKGKVIDEPVISYDYFTTFCDMLSISPKKINQKLDGISMWPLWTGKKDTLKKRALYWHYPLEDPRFIKERSAAAIRYGDWKLIQFYYTGNLELYNLKNDISETKNILSEHLDIATNLMKMLNKWRNDVGAVVPVFHEELK